MCRTKRLLAAEQQCGCVTLCDCGTVHLTVGIASLALDEKTLRQLHRLLGAALKQLPDRADDLAQATMPSVRLQ